MEQASSNTDPAQSSANESPCAQDSLYLNAEQSVVMKYGNNQATL